MDYPLSLMINKSRILRFSAHPDESAHEAEKAHIVGVELVKAAENVTVVLNIVDKALHQVALSVKLLI
jgi:hypothetical protein